MGWIRDEDGAYEHEGYIVGVLTDGTVPMSEGSWGSYPRTWMGSWSGDREGLPEVPPAALRATCDCGWTGDDVRIDPDVAEAWADEDEEPLRDQWEKHVDQVLAGKRGRDTQYAVKSAVDRLARGSVHPLDALAALTETQQYIERLIAASVADARGVGASWSQVGGALGVAKQTVHRKYGRPGDVLDDADDTLGSTVAQLRGEG